MGFKGGDSFEVEGDDNGNVEFRAEVLSAFFSMEWEFVKRTLLPFFE